jgi:hypothetical protein
MKLERKKKFPKARSGLKPISYRGELQSTQFANKIGLKCLQLWLEVVLEFMIKNVLTT